MASKTIKAHVSPETLDKFLDDHGLALNEVIVVPHTFQKPWKDGNFRQDTTLVVMSYLVLYRPPELSPLVCPSCSGPKEPDEGLCINCYPNGGYQDEA